MGASADGAELVRAGVDRFSERMLTDPELGRFFAGVDLERLRAHQRAFVTASLIGGDLYRRGMAAAHGGLGNQDGAFDRAVRLLLESMREVGASEDALHRLAERLEPLRREIVRA